MNRQTHRPIIGDRDENRRTEDRDENTSHLQNVQKLEGLHFESEAGVDKQQHLGE
jgi:hypothetical protein